MSDITTWSKLLDSSFGLVLNKTIGFLPELIAALVVIIVGFFIANGLGLLTEKIVNLLKIDNLLEKMGFDRIISRTSLRLKTGRFLGGIVYWLVAVAFLITAADILSLEAVSSFLEKVLNYLPNLIIAVLILVATFYFANFIKSVVRHSAKIAKMAESDLLGSISWWVLVVFGFASALSQLGINQEIMNFLDKAIIGTFAVAIALSFGLGGKDLAREALDKLKREAK